MLAAHGKGKLIGGIIFMAGSNIIIKTCEKCYLLRHYGFVMGRVSSLNNINNPLIVFRRV